jgi:simple sugar transport system permease protein
MALFIVLFAIGGLMFRNFVSWNNVGSMLTDNSFIIIAAIGETFVIISGGIDLSVGSMIGFVVVVMAHMDTLGWHPLASGAMMILFGIAFGAFQGIIIDFCEIQPFIITLAGLFMLRGACFLVSLESVPIKHPFVDMFADLHIDLGGGGRLSSLAIVMLVVFAAGVVIGHFNRFGTNFYARRGDLPSAKLMGVPIPRSTIMIYVLAAFYSVLGGVVYGLCTLGDPGRLSSIAIVMLIALASGIIIAHFTRFGANVYAWGGDPQSAKLMGVPVRRTLVKIYALAGFYSALGGVVFALYTGSGEPRAAVGDELDAIVAVVLGGTLLTGGVGLVFGTLFGGLIRGLITVLVNFQGTLTSEGATIIIGVLLCVFVVAQRAIMSTFMGRRAV